jgi:hypothetical protein
LRARFFKSVWRAPDYSTLAGTGVGKLELAGRFLILRNLRSPEQMLRRVHSTLTSLELQNLNSIPRSYVAQRDNFPFLEVCVPAQRQ